MVFITRILVAIFFVIISLAGGAAAEPASCPESAQVFWSSFRDAVLKKGVAEVSKYTSFPFQVAGELDSSEKREVDKAEFAQLFPTLMTTDPGMSPEPTTMRCLVKGTSTLPPRACNQNSKEFRVGSWLFRQTGEGWRFIRAYIEE